MTNADLDQPAIAGLVVPDVVAHDSAMVKAAKQTLETLRAAGTVGARHAVQVQLVLQLAAAIDAGTRSGRASAVAMAAAQLRETMLVLDPPDEAANSTGRERLDALLEQLEAAANADAAAAAPA